MKKFGYVRLQGAVAWEYRGQWQWNGMGLQDSKSFLGVDMGCAGARRCFPSRRNPLALCKSARTAGPSIEPLAPTPPARVPADAFPTAILTYRTRHDALFVWSDVSDDVSEAKHLSVHPKALQS